MDVGHVATVSSRRAAGGKIPVAVSVGQDLLTVACPDGGGFKNGCYAVSLFHYEQTTAPLEVVSSSATASHREPVQALEFCSGVQPLLLCSASYSSTLLWEVDPTLGEGETVILLLVKMAMVLLW